MYILAFASSIHNKQFNVCVTYKSSSRRARQFMSEVPWPDRRVQIRQTSKQVVVQSFGLTSDRKTVPRPPSHHPSQSQYMWSLKMDASGILLQERNTTCDAEHARAFALWLAFFRALLRRAAPENRSWRQKTRKIHTGFCRGRRRAGRSWSAEECSHGITDQS